MRSSRSSYRGYRFPPKVIEHAVWLYHCFSLSLRDVELILAARGVTVSDESIRDWGIRFGRQFAATLKRRRPGPGDKWFLDEVFVRIRAGCIISGGRWIRTGSCLISLCRGGGIRTPQSASSLSCSNACPQVSRVIMTDKLKSYAAAKRELLPNVEHRQSRYLNNSAEVSHQPTRRRERQMQRFKSARQAQRFLSAHSRIHNHFQLRRHLISAAEYRSLRDTAFRVWQDATAATAA